MHIFKLELKVNIGSTLLWTIALVAIASLYILIYPSLGSASELNEVVKNFPDIFRKAFGIANDGFSAFNAIYAMILNLVLLVGAVQAMNLGTNILSKEVREKTADFLLSKPVSRKSIVSQKIIASLILLLITNIIYLSYTWLLIQATIVDRLMFQTFMISSLTLLFVQLFFFCLGFLVGTVVPRIKSVIAISLPVVFAFYFIGLLDDVVGVETIRFLTPFKFFDISKLVVGGEYSIGILSYLCILVISFIVLSFVIYQKKDINSL